MQYTSDVGIDPKFKAALEWAMGDILSAGNPYANAAMDAATQQITDNFIIPP